MLKYRNAPRLTVTKLAKDSVLVTNKLDTEDRSYQSDWRGLNACVKHIDQDSSKANKNTCLVTCLSLLIWET